MALQDLLAARTREEVVARMLLALGRPDLTGLPVTDWHSGGVTRTLVEIGGEAIADVERRLEQLGYGGYLQTASGEWLDELVQSQYGLTRQAATFARGLVTFSGAAGVSAELEAGLLVQTTSGRQYSTLERASLPAGGTVSVLVQAQEPGSAANVARDAITQMVAPLPGVRVSNVGSWLVNAGADRETDAALRLRAQLQWPALGGGMTRAAYEHAALSAAPAVDRVLILDEHPRGQGTVDVVVWGTGGIGAEDVAAVNAVVQARRPLTTDVQVYAATERPVVLDLQLYAPLLSEVEKVAAEAAVIGGMEQLARETPIGGTLYHAQVIEVAMQPAGVLDAVVQGRPADTVLGRTEGLTVRTRVSWRKTP